MRDVGGLPTADGGRVREGVLIRADSLQYLSPDGVEVVRRAGIGRILDLRGDGEVAGSPTPFTGDPLGIRQALQDPADPDHGQATIVDACIWMLDRRPEKPVVNAYTRRLQLYRGEIGPDAVVTAADTDDVQIATLAHGLGNWYLVRGDKAQARKWFERSVQASGGWPGFGFIVSEVELRRLRR